jgi:hypothetical protein
MKRDSLVTDTYSEGAFYPELDMAKSEPTDRRRTCKRVRITANRRPDAMPYD